MAATNRSELLLITKKEFTKLEKLTSTVSAPEALRQHEDGITIKDVLVTVPIGLSFFWGGIQMARLARGFISRLKVTSGTS